MPSQNRLGLIAGLIFTVIISIAAQSVSTTGASAQTLSTLQSFNGSGGVGPYAGLIADASGALYGTTLNGGAHGSGTVFKLNPPTIPSGPWTEAVLHDFSGISDGAIPSAGLIADASGALYGTTYSGGAFDSGTVFKLTPASDGTWGFVVLYSFTGGIDGANPSAALVADASGVLYSTTWSGGAYSSGTVFKLTPPAAPGGDWTETTLYSFQGGSDGAFPGAGLIFDSSGALYGTTYLGGAVYFVGTVFKLTPPGTPGGNWTETVLHTFTGPDGANPYAGLISDATGALYGTTAWGGVSQNYGTAFKLSPPAAPGGTWTQTVLYRFTGGDGANPYAGLIADASGALYGTTESGGTYTNGTVFKLTPPTTTSGTWSEKVLHSFLGRDGAQPVAGLMSDTSGSLYGTTVNGGASNSGTIFKLGIPATFVGVPGQGNCIAQSIAVLAHEYGGIARAASALGYAGVTDLQNTLAGFCGG